MEPNVEQIKSGIRWFVTTFGGFIAGWFASKGWFSVDEVISVLNNPVLISAAASLFVGGLGLFVHKQSNAVAVVAAIAADPTSPVKGVVVERSEAGRTLATNISNSNVDAVIAPAGSDAAERIAKL